MKRAIAVLTSVLGFASIAKPDQTDRILTALNGSLSYDSPDKSFSPFYSDIGLGFAGDAGIASLYLHYNRKTTALGGPFLAAGDDSVETSGNVLSVHQQSGSGALDYVFFGRNSWLVECDSPRTLSYLFTSEKKLTEARGTFDAANRIFLFDGYLPTAMTACGELANAIGDHATAHRMAALAQPYAKKMVELLYDPEAGIFRDVLIKTGVKVNIVTPASLLPLLARVPIEPEKAEAMIRKYLLNPKKLFGKYPFPSVAYDEPTYEPRNQARGPTWMPTVYMMLQVLKMYGFDDAYAEAKARAYDMVLRDGRIMEKFDSQTGEGIGHTQQGWTAAVFLRLKLDAEEKADSESRERSAGR